MDEIGPISLIIALILLNGILVAAEFAFARVRKTQIEHIIESGTEKERKSASLLLKIVEDINNYVSTCQVGITVASLALGALAEVRVEHWISPWLETLPYDIDSHAVAIFIAVTLITFFHVVVGEVVPKTLALKHPEEVGMALAGFLEFLHVTFSIPVFILNESSNICLRVMGIEPVVAERAHTEAELKKILSSSQEEGILEEEEEELIQNVFDFNDTVAKEIMTPRTDMVSLEEDMTIEQAIKKMNETGYSRCPIFKERLDNITGYVTIKDVVAKYSDGEGDKPLKSVKTDILKVSDGVFVIDLMKNLQKKKRQLALLIDEFGGTSGLVTTEDIVEEIFGEIQDEHEAELEQPIRQLDEKEFVVDGLVTLKDLNEEIGTKFESEHYETIGGFVFGLVGSDPKPGDRIEHEGYTLIVDKHDNQRVRVVRILAA